MLVHLAATLANWDPKLLDLPGVGASKGKVAVTISKMAKQALAIIKVLELKEIDLLGLSMGDMIAQEFVKLDQTLVKHLILVGTGAKRWDRGRPSHTNDFQIHAQSWFD